MARRRKDAPVWDEADFADEPAPDEFETGADDEFVRYRPPLPADGIRARARRGAIGESWWSKRFLAALEDKGADGRLSRGRSYARKGQVLHIDVEPGQVSATVQGSRPEPYEVRLYVTPVSEAKWGSIEDDLVARAGFAAGLLAGRLLSTIEDVFRVHDVELFPASSGVAMSCTCPDWEVPCKHVAAVCYLVAESLDADPFLLLAWLGRDRDSLLSRLSARRAGAAPEQSGAAEQAGVPSAAGVRPADPARFWIAGEALDGVRATPRAGRISDAALARLGPLGLHVGRLDVEDVLGPMYLRFTRAVEDRALGT